MANYFLLFLLTFSLQIIGQTSARLVGNWVLKNHVVEPSSGWRNDSLKIDLEFANNGVYTIRYTHIIKNPMIAKRPTVTSGKWKIDSLQRSIRLYNTWQESPSPHQIPDKDLQIIKLTKKQFIIYENLTAYPGGKSTYVKQRK